VVSIEYGKYSGRMVDMAGKKKALTPKTHTDRMRGMTYFTLSSEQAVGEHEENCQP
jgi:hypothetical protein